MARSLRESMPGLFPPEPAPPAAARPQHDAGCCACCNHPESKHCKGNVSHAWKCGGGKLPRGYYHCTTRHCDSVLCCCTNFARTAADVAPLQRPYTR